MTDPGNKSSQKLCILSIFSSKVDVMLEKIGNNATWRLHVWQV